MINDIKYFELHKKSCFFFIGFGNWRIRPAISEQIPTTVICDWRDGQGHQAHVRGLQIERGAIKTWHRICKNSGQRMSGRDWTECSKLMTLQWLPFCLILDSPHFIMNQKYSSFFPSLSASLWEGILLCTFFAGLVLFKKQNYFHSLFQLCFNICLKTKNLSRVCCVFDLFSSFVLCWFETYLNVLQHCLKTSNDFYIIE